MVSRCGLEKSSLVGMGFDGPSAMKKLANEVKEFAGEQAFYVHRLTNCTELSLQDDVKQSDLLNELLQMCQDLWVPIQKGENFLTVSSRSKKNLKKCKNLHT